MIRIFLAVFMALSLLLSGCGSSDPNAAAQSKVERHLKQYQTVRQRLHGLSIEKPKFKKQIEELLVETDDQISRSKSKSLTSNVQEKEEAAVEIKAVVTRLETFENKINPPPPKPVEPGSKLSPGTNVPAQGSTNVPPVGGKLNQSGGSGFGSQQTQPGGQLSPPDNAGGSGFGQSGQTGGGAGFIPPTQQQTGGSGFGSSTASSAPPPAYRPAVPAAPPPADFLPSQQQQQAPPPSDAKQTDSGFGGR